jgi:hypothetical protein
MTSNDPIAPKYKAITLNRMPEHLVTGIKILAVRLDCTVEDLMAVVIEKALKDDIGNFRDVYRLKQARKKEIEDRRKLRATMEQLQPKLEALEKTNG